jgi:hypothetical protein
MDLPIQAPPVMRGHSRLIQAQQAANSAVAQSQATTGLSSLCAACALAPPPWNLVCQLLCPTVTGGLGNLFPH